MKRQEVIEEIYLVLTEDLNSGEYIQLVNDLRKNSEFNIPEIHGMDDIEKFKYCKKSEYFDENAAYFIVNESNEKVSSNYPDDLVDPDIIADFLLRFHDIKTKYEKIDILVEDYWKNIKAVLEFLSKIPEDTFIMLWNNYQKEINGENYLYRMNQFVDAVYKNKYTLHELAKHLKGFNSEDNCFIVENGDFKSSKHLEFLINVVELANYYQ